MKKTITRSLGAVLAAILCTAPSYARQGAPHTLTADAQFTTVDLKWRAPQAPKTLQWHNDYDYNGDNFTVTDTQKAQVCYAGARFTADDLKEYVGEVVDGITFHQYNDVVKVSGIVYEDGKIVAQGVADHSKYAKNEKLKIELDNPVAIKADTEYIFAIKVEGGLNMTYPLMKDKATDAPGKGDLYSLDGVHWTPTGNGDYLVTANLVNDVDETPADYTIYVDGNAVPDAEIIGATNEYSGVTEYTSTLSLAAGEHTIYVAAAYDGNAYKSFERKVTALDFDATAPSARFMSASATAFDVDLYWAAPLRGGSTLTWAENATTDFGAGMMAGFAGGTASKNAKIWVRNSFDATDLTPFGSNAKIKDIKVCLGEGTISGLTLFVMRDEAIAYSQALTADELAAIQANAWNTFTLTTPFALTPGHSYAYGFYATHNPNDKFVGIFACETRNNVGNSYSVSSPSSTFDNSKPSWRTLRQGNVEGNWAMMATLEDATSISAPTGYTLTRNGETIATGLTDKIYKDVVPAPGRYVYAVYPEIEGKAGYPDQRAVNATLPADYAAPNLQCSYNHQTGEVSLAWDLDKLLAKYKSIDNYAGFDEEMTMMWGAQLTADELKPYAGMKITKLNIALGDEIGAFKAGIYTAKGTALSEASFEAGQIEPLNLYTVTLDTPVEITGEEDLYIAYSGTLPAGTTPLLLDNGPAATGGARVSLTGGLTWMNLGTIATSYADNNIVIGALAADQAGNTTEVLPRPIAATPMGTCHIEATEEPLAVAYTAAYRAPAAKAPAVPRAKSFNLYRNGVVILNTQQTTYEERVSFNEYTYSVTALYEDGWESPHSAEIPVHIPIAQKGVAPYALTGIPVGSTLNLEWQPGDQAPSLTYVQGTKIAGYGLSGTPHVFVKFLADDLKPYVGQRIDHVLFGLYSDDVTNAAIEIAEGENIVYKQSVPSPVTGWNDIRLNEPYLIKAGTDLHIGYTLKHTSKVKPLGIDALEDGTYPSDTGKADIYSTSASPGYWYTLAAKKKANYNWAIKAVLASDNTELNAQEADGTTYNLYYNGNIMRRNITGTTTAVSDAPEGEYCVTAVSAAGIESGESNKVNFIRQNIDAITADAAGAEYYNLQGIRVDADSLTPGIYVRRTADGKAAKVIVK